MKWYKKPWMTSKITYSQNTKFKKIDTIWEMRKIKWMKNFQGTVTP